MRFIHKTFGVFIIISALIFINGCSDPEKEAMEHLNKGEEYFANGEYQEAIIEYRNVVKLLPKNAEARYKLGLAYLEINDTSKAFQQLQRAASLDLQNFDAHYRVGEMLADAKPEEAQKYITHALELKPDNEKSLILLARIHDLIGDMAKALETIDRLSVNYPDNCQALLLRAEIYKKSSKISKTEEVLYDALNYDECKLEAYKGLIQLSLSRNDLNKAKMLLEEMARDFPESYEVLLGLATLAKRQHSYDRAEAYIKKALQLNPENEEIYLYQARFYANTGQFSRAENAYTSLLSITDRSDTVKAKLADFYIETGKYDEARRLIDEVFQNDEHHLEAQLAHAKLLFLRGEESEALALTDRLLDADPTWGQLHLLRAHIYQKRGDSNLAYDSAQSAVRYIPGEYAAHQMLAKLMLEKNDYRSARDEAALALALQPAAWPSALLIAKSYVEEKKYERAEFVLGQLRKEIPANIQVQQTYGEFLILKDDSSSALQTFLHILDLDPDYTPALEQVVLLLEKSGQIDRAGQLLQTYTEKSANNTGHLLAQSKHLLRRQKFSEAVTVLEKVKEIKPDLQQAFILTARAKRGMGNLNGAILEYRNYLTEYPSDTNIQLQLALLYEQKGDPAAAADLYEQILDINRNHVVAANNLALYLSEQPNGDLGRALSLAMRSVDQAPDNPSVLDTLGVIYLKKDANALAVSTLKSAIALAPESPEIRQHLEMAENALVRERYQAKVKDDSQLTEQISDSLSIGEHIEVNAEDLK